MNALAKEFLEDILNELPEAETTISKNGGKVLEFPHKNEKIQIPSSLPVGSSWWIKIVAGTD